MQNNKNAGIQNRIESNYIFKDHSHLNRWRYVHACCVRAILNDLLTMVNVLALAFAFYRVHRSVHNFTF